MAFKVDVAGMEELGQHQYLTEVVIERHLYEHTRAHLTWRWAEHNQYGERPTALLAGKALNCPVDKIINAGDLAKPITLSLQYLETDYQYLTRMCHAWSVPVAVVDLVGDVQLGAKGVEAGEAFPDINFGWAEVSFGGALPIVPQVPGGSSGPTALARGQAGQHLGQLTRLTADYMQAPERPDITGHVSHIKGHNDVSGYYLRLEGMVLPFAPGQVVSFEGQQHLIHQTRIVGHPEQTTGTQELWLQPLTQPLPPHKERPDWPSQAVWGHVTANEHDPLQQGRVQVEFEWEHLDPQPSSERAWLHLLTPYGGGHEGGKKAAAYSGFYSVPKVGERVLGTLTN